jgi:hypothetical protein
MKQKMRDLDELLTEIIDHAKMKGAPIIGWQYSANEKIIINFENAVPLYCINLYQAIDLLIHQYNLVKEYSFIYAQINQKTDAMFAVKKEPSKMNEELLAGRAIELCNAVFHNATHAFNTDTQNKLYTAIHKANNGKYLPQNDFLQLRSSLSEYYTNLHLSSDDSREREDLRKIVHFFEKMKYRDFSALF